jgi:hypothetical protein
MLNICAILVRIWAPSHSLIAASLLNGKTIIPAARNDIHRGGALGDARRIVEDAEFHDPLTSGAKLN